MKDMTRHEVEQLAETLFGSLQDRKVKTTVLPAVFSDKGTISRNRYEGKGVTLVVRDYYEGSTHLWAIETMSQEFEDNDG